MEMTPMPVEPERSVGKSSTNLVLTILVAILLLGNGVTLYFLLKKPVKVQESITNTVVTNDNVNQDLNNSENININTPLDNSEGGNIQVAFGDWPTVVNKYDFFDYQKIDGIINALKGNVASQQDSTGITTDSFLSRFTIYKVGKVTAGKYVDKDLFVIKYQAEGPVMASTYRVIKNGDELMFLAKQSESIYSVSEDPVLNKIFTKYNNLYILGLDAPTSIAIPNSSIVLKLINSEPYLLVSEYSSPQKLFKYNDKDYVYKDEKRNCFFVRAADGTAREYYLDLPFLADSSYQVNAVRREAQLLNITFSDSTINKNKYNNADPVGCGVGSCYNYANYISNISQLKEIAQASNGDKLYELKDNNLKANNSDEWSILRTIYEQYYPGYDEKTQKEVEKISFDKFLLEHPLLFWQDPFGKFISFTNTKYAPVAECGKPVIYLYPTKTTNVSVKVNPTGGFTKTEPDYGTGWLVKAEPNGNLYNYQDKKNYPYLFWEGYGLNYQMSNEGFVVAKNDVNKFLREKLAIQGLNEKEINDFLEFWLPRMQSDPYYFVTFVPQAEFDKMAPLTVSPKPDSVIRVFMDFRALDKPIQVKEQKLPAQGGSALGGTPQRTGFTVVEWGGELQK